jgi:hypothetical protein
MNSIGMIGVDTNDNLDSQTPNKQPIHHFTDAVRNPTVAAESPLERAVGRLRDGAGETCAAAIPDLE